MPVIPSDEWSPVGDIQVAATCTVSKFSVARSILTFFAINIIGHAVTMTKRPGQSTSSTILYTIGTILTPIVMRVGNAAFLACALYALRRRWSDAQHSSWRSRFRIALFGTSDVRWPLQSAIDSGAVAIEIAGDSPFSYDAIKWTRLTQNLSGKTRGLYMDGTQVNWDKKGVRYRLVPRGTMTSSNIQFPSTSSTLKNILTIAQLIYSALQLYDSSKSNIRERGLSSPFTVVIPYMISSFVNLIINMIVLEYPYVLVLRPKRELCSRAVNTTQDVPPAHVNSLSGYSSALVDIPPEHGSMSKKARASFLEADVTEDIPLLEVRPQAQCLNDLESTDFDNWLQDNFDLKRSVAISYPKYMFWKMFVPVLATAAWLAIVLPLTRVQIVKPIAAASFLSWHLCGWLMLAVAEMDTRMGVVLFIPVAVLCIAVPIWGMVYTVIELIPYYSQCGNT